MKSPDPQTEDNILYIKMTFQDRDESSLFLLQAGIEVRTRCRHRERKSVDMIQVGKENESWRDYFNYPGLLKTTQFNIKALTFMQGLPHEDFFY